MKRAAAALVLALGTAILLTWPMARSSLLPIGQEPVPTVPFFNAYTIWWNLEQAGEGWSGYWDAPFFHPGKATFALSEPQPFTIVLLPVWWLTGSLWTVYRCYILLGMTLNGFFGWRLLRTLRVQPCIALATVPLFVGLPMVHWLSGVVQLVGVWAITFAIERLLETRRRPSVGNASWLAIAYVLTWLQCSYYGLFLTLVLAVAGAICHIDRLRFGPTWRTGITFTLIAAAVIGPFLASHVTHIKSHRIEPTTDRIVAPALAFATTPWRLETNERWAVGSGWGITGLAIFGVVIGLRKRCWRMKTRTLLATALIGMLMASDWGATINDWFASLPAFGHTRNQFRIAIFWQLGTLALAALAVDSAVSRLKSRHGSRLAWTAGCFVLAACLLENIPRAGTYVDPPSLSKYGTLVDWIGKLPQDEPIAFLPVSPSAKVQDFQNATRWMLVQTWHRHPIVNGYSANGPKVSVRLYNQLRVGNASGLPPVGVRWAIRENDRLKRFECLSLVTKRVTMIDYGPRKRTANEH